MLIKVGKIHNISLEVNDANNYPIIDDIVTATIQDKSSEKFFNGLFWTDNECELIIPHKENGLYMMNFIPEQASLFEINIKSKAYKVIRKEILQSTDIEDDIDPGMSHTPITKINNKVFKNQDGTDTTVLDSNRNPLAGVKISCYDSKTKMLVAVTQSDNSGAWEMILKHGTYLFMFDKDGYVGVSFERTVDICL